MGEPPLLPPRSWPVAETTGPTKSLVATSGPTGKLAQLPAPGRTSAPRYTKYMAAERDWMDGRVDRTSFSVAKMTDPDDALQYWLSRPVSERLEALELARRICYGEAAATERLQRVLEVAELK